MTQCNRFNGFEIQIFLLIIKKNFGNGKKIDKKFRDGAEVNFINLGFEPISLIWYFSLFQLLWVFDAKFCW